MNNIEIKNKIIDKIELLKNGNEYDILLACEIQKYIQDIQCFYCFDNKKLWGYRSEYHVFFSRFANNHNTFWIGQCNKCGEHKFLYDTNNNEIIIDNCFKLFCIDDSSSTSRINELLRVSKDNVNKIMDRRILIKDIVNDFIRNEYVNNQNLNESNNIDKNEIKNNEEPDYEVEANFFTQKITKTTLSADIKNISQIIGVALQGVTGIFNIDLLSKIEVSINFESINKRKEKVFYKSSDNNDYFIFIILKHIVKDKNGNILSIFSGEKSDTSIDCYYWIYKTRNQVAIDICKRKIKEAVENELKFMSQILQSHYNK